MSKLQQPERPERVTTTLREAVVRNAMAEQRMKVELGVMKTEVNKHIQSMKAFQNKYEKRQKELKQIRAQRLIKEKDAESVRPHSAARKISAPPTFSFSVETIDLNSGEFLTTPESTAGPRRQRSLSAVPLPKLNVSSSDGILSAQRQLGGEHFPPLTMRPTSASPITRQKSNPSLRPKSSMLTVDCWQQVQSRSAPTSPTVRRKGQKSPAFNRPTSGNRCISPTMRQREDILETLEKDSFSSLSEWRQARAGAICSVEVKDDEVSLRKEKQSYRFLGPDATFSTPIIHEEITDQKSIPTLAESMDKIKYCKYLRNSAYDDETVPDELPKELIPTSIIIGDVKVVDFKGK